MCLVAGEERARAPVLHTGGADDPHGHVWRRHRRDHWPFPQSDVKAVRRHLLEGCFWRQLQKRGLHKVGHSYSCVTADINIKTNRNTEDGLQRQTSMMKYGLLFCPGRTNRPAKRWIFITFWTSMNICVLGVNQLTWDCCKLLIGLCTNYNYQADLSVVPSFPGRVLLLLLMNNKEAGWNDSHVAGFPRENDTHFPWLGQ